MTPLSDQIKHAIWDGFRNVGILNGIPAAPTALPTAPTYHPRHVGPTCYRGKDGSEFWRNVGLGSI